MMKPFWLGLLGSFVGFMLLAAMAFYTDIFTIEKDGAPKFRVSDAGKITVGATESYVNLVIQNNAAAANNKVDIAADVLTVEGVRLENVNVAADITSSAAGGLDTGVEASSTWYYVWAITNNDGTSINGLLSTSSASPTLPSGYTKKRRVGAVRNDGSSNFLQFLQEGSICNYIDGSVNYRILSSGTATSFTTIGTGNFVAPTSRRCKLLVTLSAGHGTAGQVMQVRIRKTGSGAAYGQVLIQAGVPSATIRAENGTIADLETDASRQIDYFLNATPTSGGVFIDVVGYYDRI